MHRFLLLATVVCFGVATASAQKTRVYGRVFDSQSGEALVRATVQLMKPDTTSMITGDVTGSLGTFTIKNVAAGDYVVKISYIGYHNFFRKITVAAKQQEQNVGTVMLVPSSVLLETAVVSATLPQMEVKEDTLIFNADAFKVPEGSVLEELIRKLPGAEVSSDGTIKINGKTITKILVEGKEFFSNDKSMAMKNLPSEIVDQVKTYDKQSDMAEMTGIDDGEEETVIDLTIKKGMKQGWFGNIDLAGGTEDRFSEKIMLNRFADNTQASLIGSYNNTNDQSFPGGGGRGMGGNGGETKSGMGGFNFALERGDWEVGGNVRYSGNKSNTTTRSSSQNFVTTSTSYSNAFSQSVSTNNNINGDFRIEWKPDSMTTMLFRPNFSFGNSKSNSTGENATFNYDPYSNGITDPLSQLDLIDDSIKVNYNGTGSKSKSNSYSLGGNLIINRRLNNVGRNFSINVQASYSDNTNKSYSLSDVRYFQYGDSTELTYRYQTTPNYSASYTIGFNYTEPLIAKKLFLQLSYRFNHSKRHSDGSAYDMGDVEYLVDSIRATGAGYLPAGYKQYLDSDLSKYTDNWNDIHNIDVQLRLVTTFINMNVGVSIEPQHQKVKYQYQGLDTIASRNFARISPTLNFRYRFTKQHVLRVRYRASTQQPEITDMFNMTDNSDPLNIREGNPGLKPSFTQNISVDWNDYVTSTLQNFNARLNFSTTANSISNRTEYNESTGGRTTRPENINGNWDLSGNFGFNTPVFTDNLYFNTSSSASYQNNVAYIYQDEQSLKNKVKNLSLGERLTINLRQTYWDVSLEGSLTYNNVRSELVPTNNRDTYDFSYGASANMNLDNGFAASTNLSMSSRRGYSSADMNTDELIWNAQVSYRFLKNKVATISLQAYDILNQRSNISRMISATSRTDSETNAVNSYLMAHFIYRFNMFGSAQARREMRERRRGNMDFY